VLSLRLRLPRRTLAGLLCALSSMIPPRLSAGEDGVSQPQELDRRENQLREEVWSLYTASGVLGADDRGRTLSLDLREWVMTSQDSATLRMLRAEADRQASTGNEQAARAALDRVQSLLEEQERRLTLVEDYWIQRLVLDRQRSLWLQWVAQVTEADANPSRSRVQEAEQALRQQLSPALTKEVLIEKLEALKRTYDEERLKLAGWVSDQRHATGGVMSSRERSIPCPEPYVDAKDGSDAAAGRVGDRPIRALTYPSIQDFYSTQARKDGSTGRIVLRLDVDASGCMQRASVLHSSGDPQLDDAAIDVAEYSRYAPAVRGGVSVPASVSLPVAFHLSNSVSAPVDGYLRTGVNLAARAEYAGAIGQFGEALKIDPRSDLALSHRGMAYLRERNSELARQDFDAAFAINPRNAEVLRGRGYLAAGANDAREAVAQFTSSLDVEPDSTDALRGRASAYTQLGMWDQALADGAEIIRLRPDSSSSYVFRGNLLLDHGRYDLAVTDLNKALEISPRSDTALAERGLAYVWERNYDLARSDFDAAFAINSKNAVVARGRGLLAAKTGEYSDAVDQLTRALELEPDNVFALRWRAWSHSMAGERDKAVADSSELVRLYPNLEWTYLNRISYRSPEDSAGKRSDIYLALKINSRSANAFRVLAQLPTDAQGAARDIALLNAAITDQADSIALLTSRGIIYWKSNQSALAGRDFAAARSKATKASEHNYLCWELATASVDLPVALEECDAALAQAPDDGASLDSRGFVLLRLGRYDESVAAYDASLRSHPTLADSLYGRGLAKRARGEVDAADVDIRAAIAADPLVADRFATYGLKPRITAKDQ
jgi:TonB family protein